MLSFAVPTRAFLPAPFPPSALLLLPSTAGPTKLQRVIVQRFTSTRIYSRGGTVSCVVMAPSSTQLVRGTPTKKTRGGITARARMLGWGATGGRIYYAMLEEPSRVSVGALFGAGADGDDGGETKEEDNSKEEAELGAKKENPGGTIFSGSGDDILDSGGISGASSEAFSYAEPEDPSARSSAEDVEIGLTADNADRWLPRLFPPPSDQDENGNMIQPLIELPLDGSLLLLFPALLIGVVGLFVTVAVQVEASRFDGMGGGDGGAVVVTDLRDIRKSQP